MRSSQERFSSLIPAAFTLLFAWMILWSIRPISNADFWWHLAGGRFIAKVGYVPLTDVFSFTVSGRRWVNGYWLYEVLLFAVFRLGGIHAVILAKSLLVALIFWITKRRLDHFNVHWLLQMIFLIITFIGIPLSSLGWTERADLVTLFFLSLLFWHMERDGGTSRWRKSRWLWPFLFMLWANAHPGFMLGLVTAGFFTAGAIVERKESLRSHALWLAACFLATFVNPNGYLLYNMLFHGLEQCAFIAEWHPTPWVHFQTFWFLLAGFWSLYLGGWITGRKLPLARLLTALFFTWASIRYVLNVPFFCIGVVPFALDFMNSMGWTQRIAKEYSRYAAAAAGALILVFLGSIAYAAALAKGGILAQRFPIDACEFIASQRLQGHFFNEYNFGSYWIWRLDSQAPVFIDGRFLVVEGYADLYKRLVEARQGSPAQWNAFLDGYGVTGALVAYPGPSSMPSVFHEYFPAASWALVYWDDVCALYLKRSPDRQAFIDTFEYKNLYPDMSPDMFLQYASQASPSRRSHLHLNLERNLRLHPLSRRTRNFLALLDKIS